MFLDLLGRGVATAFRYRIYGILLQTIAVWLKREKELSIPPFVKAGGRPNLYARMLRLYVWCCTKIRMPVMVSSWYANASRAEQDCCFSVGCAAAGPCRRQGAGKGVPYRQARVPGDNALCAHLWRCAHRAALPPLTILKAAATGAWRSAGQP